MSLVQLQEVVADCRADLEKTGVIRGIDLDYLLDPRVDHKLCFSNFMQLVQGPLARWRAVREVNTDEQWANLEAIDDTADSHPKIRALKKATKAVKSFFKGRVLCFYKDAERKSNEERDAKRATASPVGVEGVRDPYLDNMPDADHMLLEEPVDEQQ